MEVNEEISFASHQSHYSQIITTGRSNGSSEYNVIHFLFIYKLYFFMKQKQNKYIYY